MRTSLVLLVLVLVSVFAKAALAAGGGPTLTKAQVIRRGSHICQTAERRVDRLPQIRSQHPFAPNAPKGDKARAIRFLAGYADSLQSVRVGLAKLRPPARGRALLEGFVVELGPAVGAFRAAHADAMAGRYHAAELRAKQGFSLFERASKKTRAYGFPKGVCQAGSSG